VAETGPVREVFQNPKSKAAKQLLLLRESEQLEEELAEVEEAEDSQETKEEGRLRVIRGGAHAVS